MKQQIPGLAIRRATMADIDTARDLTMRTFGETFGHLYPPDDLATFYRQSYSRAAFEQVLSDDSQALWLLSDGGAAVGHVLAGPCRLPHAEAAPGDGEIKRLYILRTAHNGGWGRTLMQTAIEWLKSGGSRTLWVGVWSENFGAQRFYGRFGFEKAGEYLFPVGTIKDREFILRRRLDDYRPVEGLSMAD